MKLMPNIGDKLRIYRVNSKEVTDYAVVTMVLTEIEAVMVASIETGATYMISVKKDSYAVVDSIDHSIEMRYLFSVYSIHDVEFDVSNLTVTSKRRAERIAANYNAYLNRPFKVKEIKVHGGTY